MFESLCSAARISIPPALAARILALDGDTGSTVEVEVGVSAATADAAKGTIDDEKKAPAAVTAPNILGSKRRTPCVSRSCIAICLTSSSAETDRKRVLRFRDNFMLGLLLPKLRRQPPKEAAGAAGLLMEMGGLSQRVL